MSCNCSCDDEKQLDAPYIPTAHPLKAGMSCPQKPLTSGAEGAVVGAGAAVAQVAVVLLHARPSVPAVHPVAGAVALAPGFDPGRDLGPLRQVKGDAVHAQGSDAAQEAPLTPSGT